MVDRRRISDDERVHIRLVAAIVQGVCTGVHESTPGMDTLFLVLGLAEALNHFASLLVLKATELHGAPGRDEAQLMLTQMYDRLHANQRDLSPLVERMAHAKAN